MASKPQAPSPSNDAVYAGTRDNPFMAGFADKILGKGYVGKKERDRIAFEKNKDNVGIANNLSPVTGSATRRRGTMGVQRSLLNRSYGTTKETLG